MNISNHLRNSKFIIFSAVILLLTSLSFLYQPANSATTATNLNDPALIALGRKLFFNETFGGNGRTCGTCHRAQNNFTIDPSFIATLPANDALFVAEFTPALSKNFEKPKLMRKFGLILENTNGFGDLSNKFTMRSVPHTFALRTSIDSANGPRTGWGGDGAPVDGSLRSFSIGAVIQHFTKTLNRVAGVDFRLPTAQELDALAAFQLSLGRQQELSLPLLLKSSVAKRGQEIFLDNNLGKCNICHTNAGANAGGIGNNRNFDTGVETLVDRPQTQIGILIPVDDGFGTPGDGTFNTPPLVESADTSPFFHDNSISTIEGAVAFYNGSAFNNSPSGQFLKRISPNGVGIKLESTQVVAVAAFLRVINSLENIRASLLFLDGSAQASYDAPKRTVALLKLARFDTRDSIQVLKGGGLHPRAVLHLLRARTLIKKAIGDNTNRHEYIMRAIVQQQKARELIIK